MADHRPDEARSDGPHPDAELRSAWLDGELDAVERRRIENHLEACPACAAEIRALRDLEAGFADLRRAEREVGLGYDLAGVLAGRLDGGAACSPVHGGRKASSSPGWLAWLPAGIGAAVSLALGVGVGTALPGSASAVAAPTVLVGALHVFDSMPPGSLCLGSETCYAKESVQ